MKGQTKNKKKEWSKFQDAHTSVSESDHEEEDYSDLFVNTNHSQTVAASAKKKGVEGSGGKNGNFIPNTPSQYPHLHIVASSVVYSSSKNAKKIYLKKGNNLLKENIKDVLNSSELPGECRSYIQNNLL